MSTDRRTPRGRSDGIVIRIRANARSTPLTGSLSPVNGTSVTIPQRSFLSEHWRDCYEHTQSTRENIRLCRGGAGPRSAGQCRSSRRHINHGCHQMIGALSAASSKLSRLSAVLAFGALLAIPTIAWAQNQGPGAAELPQDQARPCRPPIDDSTAQNSEPRPSWQDARSCDVLFSCACTQGPPIVGHRSRGATSLSRQFARMVVPHRVRAYSRSGLMHGVYRFRGMRQSGLIGVRRSRAAPLGVRR
jgi:hypothetical protein